MAIPLTKGIPLPSALTKGIRPPGAIRALPRAPLMKGIRPPGAIRTIPRTGAPLPGMIAGGSVLPGSPSPASPAPPASTQPAAPSPLDSTYWANVNANQFKTNNQINALNLNSSQASQALQAALAQLAYQQPRDELRLEQNANQRGALYSSVYNQNLGDLNYKFLGQQGGLAQKYGNQQLSDASQIAALQGGIPLFNAQQAAAATQRAAAQAAADKTLGLGAPSGGASLAPAGSAPGSPLTKGIGAPGAIRTLPRTGAPPNPWVIAGGRVAGARSQLTKGIMRPGRIQTLRPPSRTGTVSGRG